MSSIFRFSVFLLLVSCWTGCRPADEVAPRAESPPVKVRAASAERAAGPVTVPLPGTVRATQRATVRAQIAGQVTTTSLAVGRAVAAGETLVSLAAPEWERRQEQAAAAVAELEGDREREAGLLARGVSTPETVRVLEQRLVAARAALAETEVYRAHTTIAAPFAGVVVREHVRPGDWVGAGQPLVELEGAERQEIEVAVPGRLPMVAAGATISWQSRNSLMERQRSAQVAEMAVGEDPVTRARLTRLELDPGEGKAGRGELVTVLWPVGEARATLWVPAAAVREIGQVRQVFVVVNDRARLRWVRLGRREGDRWEVLAGVEASEVVVLNPTADLRDDQPVTVLP